MPDLLSCIGSAGATARMGVLPVDTTLLDLHCIDEDESEAVALCLLELIFAETNAFYRQHCLANQAIVSTASLLTSSVFDAIAVSQLAHEDALDSSRFGAEAFPTAEINDRHAARCLPHRSPEKSGTDPVVLLTQRRRSESRFSSMSLARKRRSPEKKDSTVSKAVLMTIPQAIAMPEIVEEEDSEERTWRMKCLKELSGETSGPNRLGATSKWTTFNRQPTMLEPRVSREVEIVDSSSPHLRQELLGTTSANTIKMKSNLNTFLSISTPQQRFASAASSIASRMTSTGVVPGSSRQNLSGSQSVPALGSAPRKALQLHDSLSRMRSTASSVPSHRQHDASSGEMDPWQFELQERTPRETMRKRYVPDMMVASAAILPTSITLAPGVDFRHGESVVKGPERRDHDHTMSRKRFELHQRLATDHLLQESILLQSPGSPSSHSSTGSKSPLSTHHKQPSPRPYETVPPDPVPVPSLSPIAKNALVIPRNHLSQSVSTPNLRVRNPSLRKRSETDGHPLVTTEELKAIRLARPSTALGAVVITTRQQGQNQRPRSSTSKREASTTYLREFPKPQAGTIKMNVKKTSLLIDVDSARQRLAWIT